MLFENIEFIFVNDNSPDNSENIISKLDANLGKIKLINLANNYGQHKAIITGLKHASGDYIWLLDSDLEEKPEWIIPFYEILKKNNADVIYGYNACRKDSFLNNIFAKLFYKIINKLIKYKIQPNAITARLMTNNYKNALVSLRLNKPLIFLFQQAGFKQIATPINKHYKGVSTYDFKMKLKIFLNSLLIFGIPVKLTLFSGLIFILFSLINIFILMFNLIIFQQYLIPLFYLSSASFFTGVIITFMGINTIYINNKFKNLDDVIIREIREL